MDAVRKEMQEINDSEVNKCPGGCGWPITVGDIEFGECQACGWKPGVAEPQSTEDVAAFVEAARVVAPLNKHAARKATPVTSGVLDYFPDAIRAIAQCSLVGNEQHNPGTPLHWDRSKSQDEADALVRHLMDRGTVDDDGVRHSTKVAWRALALLQKELEDL